MCCVLCTVFYVLLLTQTSLSSSPSSPFLSFLSFFSVHVQLPGQADLVLKDIPQLLQLIHQQLQFPPGFTFTPDDEDEADFEEFRKTLRKVGHLRGERDGETVILCAVCAVCAVCYY